ncbi:MAG: DUF4214 domain-containing protein [Candidatus Bathyarchaeia archaeon]
MTTVIEIGPKSIKIKSMKEFEIIQKIYLAYLHRPADPSGLKCYSERLSKGEDPLSIAAEISNSLEFQKLYGGLKEDEIVTSLYRSLFSRDPDPEGFTFWKEQLASKNVTLDMLPYLMMDAATGIDALTIRNKIESSMNFYRVIDPDLDGYDLLATYSGDNDASMGRLFLSKVTYEEKTRKEIAEAACFILARICDPEDKLLLDARKRMQEIEKRAEGLSRTVEKFLEPSTPQEKTLALLSDAKWKEKEITYSFSVPIKPILPLESLEEIIIPPLPGNKFKVRQAFQKLSEFTDLKFKEIYTGGDINVIFADLPGESNGFTFYRKKDGYIIPPVLVILDLGYWRIKPIPLLPERESEAEGNLCSSPVIVYHSLLHALGLKHPSEGENSWKDARIPETVLAEKEGRIYTPYLIQTSDNEYEVVLRKDALPESIGFFDLEALIFKYGPNRSHNSENNIYRLEFRERSYKVIWDSGGIDLLDASNTKLNSIVNLEGGTFSSIGIMTPEVWARELIEQLDLDDKDRDKVLKDVLKKLIEYDREGILYNGINNLAIMAGTVIENVKLGSGNDTVYDNEVDNFIHLGDGLDTVFLGKGGFDTVDGGDGYDIVYLPFSKDSFDWCVLPEFSVFLHDSFAVKLISVEEIVFTDGVILL